MVALGTIDYLNTQPIERGLSERLSGVEVVRGVPTAINRALIEGRVAAGPISAYEFARYAEDLLLIPHLSIATLGAVNSVLLFSWHADPRELDGRAVALTDHSATSVHLLRVLCERHYEIAPEWRTMPQDLDAMLAVCAGALVIGDRALVEGVMRRHIGRHGLPYVFDLGDEWLKLTGLPFTFAVWAARRDQARVLREVGLVQVLHDAKREGLGCIDEIALAYAPRLGLPAGVCAKYLRDLRYDLDGADLAGLRCFLEFALPDFRWDSIVSLG